MSTTIKSMSYFIPEGRVTNKEKIEAIIEANKNILDDNQIDFLKYSLNMKFKFIGIKTRSYAEEDNTSLQMAVTVVEAALKKASIKCNEIDLLLFVGLCNPMREPSYATILANQLGMDSGDFFDINDTCNGFLKGMEIADLYINSGKYKNVVVVTSENGYELANKVENPFSVSDITDIDYKFNLAFLGSGAAAFVIQKDKGEKKFLEYYENRKSSEWDYSLFAYPFINLPSSKIFKNLTSGVWADGMKVSSTIINEMPDIVYHYLQQHHIDKSEIGCIFTHQLGTNITKAILNKIGLNNDRLLPINTFDECGNLATANIPIGIAMAEERGMLKKGERILLLSSSCGLNYAVASIIW